MAGITRLYHNPITSPPFSGAPGSLKYPPHAPCSLMTDGAAYLSHAEISGPVLDGANGSLGAAVELLLCHLREVQQRLDALLRALGDCTCADLSMAEVSRTVCRVWMVSSQQ